MDNSSIVKESFHNTTVRKIGKMFTHAVDRVILVPPDPPATIITSPLSSVIIEGHVDDNGLRPGPGWLNKGVLLPLVKNEP